MARMQPKIDEARALATTLDLQGKHTEAQIIKRLCNSASSSLSTSKQLYRDNVELREELKKAKG